MRHFMATGMTLTLLALVSQDLAAESSKALLRVSATVVSSCSLETKSVSFGTYLGKQSTPLEATANVALKCTSETPWTMTADAGQGGGLSRDRKMSSGGNRLSYNLYTDGGYTQVWGDGSGGTTPMSGKGSGATQAKAIHCRIPEAQSVPPGTYSDVVVVTVAY